MMHRNTHADNKRKKASSFFKGAKGLKLAWTEIIALTIVVFCLGFILGRMSGGTVSYDGPGRSKTVPVNEYDINSFYFCAGDRCILRTEGDRLGTGQG